MKTCLMKESKIKKLSKRIGCTVTYAMTMLMCSGITVFADDKDDPKNPTGGITDVTGGIDKLKTLFTGVIAGIGVIILAKNIMEAAQAYQQQDSASMNSALKGCVAGFIMAAIGSVLTFLGF